MDLHSPQHRSLTVSARILGAIRARDECRSRDWTKVYPRQWRKGVKFAISLPGRMHTVSIGGVWERNTPASKVRPKKKFARCVMVAA